MTLPNFLIIGAAKSGTSALYRYMKQHPDIYMSPIKEPHFFSYKDSPPNTQGPGDTINRAITDMDKYMALFDDVSTEAAIGEASPSYIYIPRASLLIREYLPKVKLIAILRQPADRAISAFMHVTRDKREPIEDFAEALESEEKRIAQNWGPIWHYKKCGYYYEQLKRYYELFNSEDIREYLYDDLSDDPIAVLQDIFRFLEVDDKFVPDIRMRVNVSGFHKSQTVDWMMERIFNRSNPVRFISRRIIDENTRWRLTSRLRNRNLVRPEIPPDVRARLTNLYKEDILNLQYQINRDLNHWLKE